MYKQRIILHLSRDLYNFSWKENFKIYLPKVPSTFNYLLDIVYLSIDVEDSSTYFTRNHIHGIKKYNIGY